MSFKQEKNDLSVNRKLIRVYTNRWVDYY